MVRELCHGKIGKVNKVCIEYIKNKENLQQNRIKAVYDRHRNFNFRTWLMQTNCKLLSKKNLTNPKNVSINVSIM